MLGRLQASVRRGTLALASTHSMGEAHAPASGHFVPHQKAHQLCSLPCGRRLKCDVFVLDYMLPSDARAAWYLNAYTQGTESFACDSYRRGTATSSRRDISNGFLNNWKLSSRLLRLLVRWSLLCKRPTMGSTRRRMRLLVQQSMTRYTPCGILISAVGTP